MSYITDLKSRIFSIDSQNFEELALEVFRYQSEYNPVYAEFIRYMHIKPDAIKKVAQIPYLPIEFFKTQKVRMLDTKPDLIFESSGTTGDKSIHYVVDKHLYRESILEAFRQKFGKPDKFTFLALLPRYQENQHSSLAFMADYLMDQSPSGASGFYLNEMDKLAHNIQILNEETETRLFLFGVSFALLDFAAKYPIALPASAVVMETGGMKGRRRELTRIELHELLGKAFSQQKIASEYGMTELLSQAYALEDGKFSSPPWMQISIRDPYDPMAQMETGQSGGINIIDLANIYSCSFIATHDMGRMHDNGEFEVLGRFDDADLRGCSLLYT